MGARISKRIEDDYPEFTDALLEVLYPHYLRPFPSCSIAYFDMEGVAAKLSAPIRVPRGSYLLSRPVRGINCRFRTAYDVVLVPVAVKAASYRGVAEAPMAVSLPPGTGAQISISFELLSDQASFAGLGTDALRFFVDGERRSARRCAMRWRWGSRRPMSSPTAADAGAGWRTPRWCQWDSPTTNR